MSLTPRIPNAGQEQESNNRSIALVTMIATGIIIEYLSRVAIEKMQAITKVIPTDTGLGQGRNGPKRRSDELD
jgi:hypothetical protein